MGGFFARETSVAPLGLDVDRGLRGGQIASAGANVVNQLDERALRFRERPDRRAEIVETVGCTRRDLPQAGRFFRALADEPLGAHRDGRQISGDAVVEIACDAFAFAEKPKLGELSLRLVVPSCGVVQAPSRSRLGLEREDGNAPRNDGRAGAHRVTPEHEVREREARRREDDRRPQERSFLVGRAVERGHEDIEQPHEAVGFAAVDQRHERDGIPRVFDRRRPDVTSVAPSEEVERCAREAHREQAHDRERVGVAGRNLEHLRDARQAHEPTPHDEDRGHGEDETRAPLEPTLRIRSFERVSFVSGGRLGTARGHVGSAEACPHGQRGRLGLRRHVELSVNRLDV